MTPLYARIDAKLNKAIRAELKRRQKQDPTFSLAALVRELLRAGLKKC